MSYWSERKPKEVWKPIYEGWYEISNHGRVRVAKTRRGGGKIGHIMAEQTNRDGYVYVVLRYNGKYIYSAPHRLVAREFIGPVPEGHEVNHKNRKAKRDNGVWNLEYLTHAENIRHGLRNGVVHGRPGEQNGRAKLTEDKVRSMRRLYGHGIWTYTELAALFNVSIVLTRHIVLRETWRHVR